MLTIFQNDGIIDIIGIKTFGVNAKEIENPIGFFGTGLKYAIAVILRDGGSFDIYRGLVRHHFSTKKINSRGKDFNVICMDEEELGFTTDLGKSWEMWQAFRELYCNTIDEGGKVWASNDIAPERDKTTIVINSVSLLTAYYGRNKFILSTAPFLTGEHCDVHVGSSDSVFYRGIAVHTLQNLSSFVYNITKTMELTEDRTIKYGWEAAQVVADTVINSTDPEFIREWLLCPDGTFEYSVEFPSYKKPGQVFLDVVRRLIKGKDSINMSASKFYTRSQLATMTPDEIELAPLEKEVLTRAIVFCKLLSFDVDDYPIIVVDSLGSNVLGEAAHNKIFLSRRAFQVGTKCVAGTLIEEYVHLKHKYPDGSRSLQNYLVDQVVTLGERVLGRTL